MLTIKLLRRLSTNESKQIIIVMLLAFIGSIAEVFSIGAAIPFLTALMNPERVYALINNHFGEIFFPSSQMNIQVMLASVFITLMAISSFLRYHVLKTTVSVSFGIGHRFGMQLFSNMLKDTILNHSQKNSSKTVNDITTKVHILIHGLLIPIISLGSSILMIILLASFIIYLEPRIALVLSITIVFTYFIIYIISKSRINSNGALISEKTESITKIIQEGIGAKREIMLNDTENIHLQKFEKEDLHLKKGQVQNYVLTHSPRYLVEMIGTSAFVGVALYFISTGMNPEEVFPTLAAFALAAQRGLPLFQQAYGSWSSIISSNPSIESILNASEIVTKSYNTMRPHYKNGILFNDSIVFENVRFRYPTNSEWVLNSINLHIKHGEKIGIIGESGSGKSTLLDCLTALIRPTFGTICVDGTTLHSENEIAWRKNLAYVPQNTFLFDATIAENIALDTPIKSIDLDKLRRAINISQLSQLITTLPDGFYTRIGERGGLLSGGQRQRIGIARAIYRGAKLIIFDESTSALDKETEYDLMNSINSISNELTIIMVAHRIDAFCEFDKIYKIKNGIISLVNNTRPNEQPNRVVVPPANERG